YSFSIRQTANGEYIIVGYTSSFGAGSDDVYLIKVDANGNSLWTKTYGGANYDGGGSVQQTADAGFIIVGFTSNFGAGQNDVYLIKTDLNGDTLWTKTFGGTHYDNGFSIQRTSDGGYIITGENDDGDSVYLIKTDSLGNSGCNQSGTTTIVTNPVTQETTPATNVTSPPTIVTTPATITSSGGTVTTLCTTVGIQSEIQNPQSAISISPNPFHSITTLTVNNNLFNDNLTLSIFNVEGKILRQQNLTSHQTIIERNGMANGLYFYKLAENGIVKSVGKLLVE
ncbi:MAG TPA: T9SS type A sorting domain-containing protein, partial [Bacteroidia bacterium]|nr:T9SS type A sorting domain-containing protein [Bacteroidia bacterium]